MQSCCIAAVLYYLPCYCTGAGFSKSGRGPSLLPTWLLYYRGFNLNYTTDLYCGLNFKHTVGSQICTVGLNFSINITTVLQLYVQLYSTVLYSTVPGSHVPVQLYSTMYW